jgi:hypothetical protein
VILKGTPPNFTLIALGAGVFAAVALWRFLVRLRRDRLVGDTPTARLRSAAQGYVKVNGRAQPAGPAPFAAPLTGRACVWWSYEIAHEEREEDERTWRVVESAASVDLFALEDEGSRCLVGPVRAEITPTAKNLWYGQSDRPAGLPPARAPLLRAGPWRYTEQLIGVGTQLCVMGELRSHSETADATQAAAAKLHEWKQDQRALLARFDLDHDGRLNAAEWDAARLAAERESQAQSLAAQIERVSVISEPVNGEPFLIAPMSGAQMGRRERRYAALYFVLGLMGVSVCAWALGMI